MMKTDIIPTPLTLPRTLLTHTPLPLGPPVDVTKLDDITDKDNDLRDHRSNKGNKNKKLFPPLANAWAAGEGAEDSLTWVAYAAQNTNLQPSETFSESNNGNANNQITVIKDKIKDNLKMKSNESDTDADRHMHSILGKK